MKSHEGNLVAFVVERLKYILRFVIRNLFYLGGTLLYHKIYMYVPSKFTIKKDYFFHKNKVKCN